MARAWQLKFSDGTTVDIDDFSPVEMAAATARSAVSWLDAYENPAVDPAVLYELVRMAAEQNQIDPPAEPSNKAEGRALLDMLELVEAIPDKPVMNDFPPTPGNPETGSGSGLPGDSDGLQTSPDDSGTPTS